MHSALSVLPTPPLVVGPGWSSDRIYLFGPVLRHTFSHKKVCAVDIIFRHVAPYWMFPGPAHRPESHWGILNCTHLKQHRCGLLPSSLAPPPILGFHAKPWPQNYMVLSQDLLSIFFVMFEIQEKRSVFFQDFLYMCDKNANPGSQQLRRCDEKRSFMRISSFCALPNRVLPKS